MCRVRGVTLFLPLMYEDFKFGWPHRQSRVLRSPMFLLILFPLFFVLLRPLACCMFLFSGSHMSSNKRCWLYSWLYWSFRVNTNSTSYDPLFTQPRHDSNDVAPF
jgi:hypothetical protein